MKECSTWNILLWLHPGLIFENISFSLDRRGEGGYDADKSAWRSWIAQGFPKAQVAGSSPAADA